MWQGVFEQHFMTGPIPVNNILHGEYNLYIVFLSYLVAVFTSYVALDMSAHLRKPTSTVFRIYWLIGGAFVMGVGIWSMHFVGMLAFIMPMPMTYNLFLTGISMVVAMVTAGLAFLFFMVKNPTRNHYILSGILIGAAIPTMHYTGMAGMNDVTIRYIPWIFVVSILIAIIAATASIWLSVKSDHGTFFRRMNIKLCSALVMGFAIAGMHYTGMLGSVFFHSSTTIAEQKTQLDPVLMAIFTTTIVSCILIVALSLSITRYFYLTITKTRNDFLRTILDNMRGGVVACNAQGDITLFNLSAENLLGDLKSIKSPTEWSEKFPITIPKTGQKGAMQDYPLYRALTGEVVRDAEIIINDKYNIPHRLLIDGQILKGTENEKLGAVIVWSDITEKMMTEKRLKERTKELEEESIIRKQAEATLVSYARQAGMAEVSTSILHNVGNVLNSVNVSSTIICEKIEQSEMSKIRKISDLMASHAHDLSTFLNDDPKGKKVLNYISLLAEYWENERNTLLDELKSLIKNIEHIKTVISMQQSMTGISNIQEPVIVSELLDDAIKINSYDAETKKIKITRNYSNIENILIDKSKLMQILINLVQNARDAVLASGNATKEIIIQNKINDNNVVQIEIIDNGEGIDEANLIEIFAYGFTTKKHGHGFGLHASALSIKEMGGNLQAESEGKGKGAKFILTFPYQPHQSDGQH